MSGVLQRLAMRVLPAPGGVRPRLGSRFEGFSGAVEPDVANLVSQSAAPIRRAPAARESMANPAAPEPGGRRPAEPPTAAPLLPPGVAASAAAATDPPRTPAARELMASPAAPEPGAGRPAEPPTAAPLLPPGVAAPAAAATDPAPPSTHEPSSTRGPPFSTRMPTPALLVPAASDVRRDAFPEALPATTAVAPHPAAPAGAADEPAAAESRPEALLLPPAPLAAAPLPPNPYGDRHAQAPTLPDIQVTIGRIETRADRNDRPPPRRAPPRPALMSLKDYLGKGRAGR